MQFNLGHPGQDFLRKVLNMGYEKEVRPAIDKIRNYIAEAIAPLNPGEQYIVIGSVISSLMALKTLAEIDLNQKFIDVAQEGFAEWGKSAYIELSKRMGIKTG
jgi:hypothetical protein